MSSEQVTDDPTSLRWFKSSYSGSGGGDCVEVAGAPGTVHVRDSKDPWGPALSFPRDQWASFVVFAKAGPAELG